MFQVKWLWKNMKGFRGRYIFALISTVVLASTGIVNALIIGKVVNDIFMPVQNGLPITDELKKSLIFWAGMIVLFTLVRESFVYLSVMTYETCSQKLVYKLRGDLYKNMQKQDSAFYNANRTGDLMTRLTGDMDMVRHTTAWVFRMIIDSFFLFCSTAVVFVVLDFYMALSLLLITPIILFITMKFSKKVGPLYVDLRERLSQLNTCTQENISGNRVVKAFAKEDYEKEKFDEKNKGFRKANLKANLLWLKFYPYIDTFSQGMSVAVLLIGGIFLISGRISLGTFTVFNGLCWTLTHPMRMVGMLVNDLQRFFASSTKIIELYYSRSTITSRHDAKVKEGRLGGSIEFKNTSLNMFGTAVLKDINLKINKGETIAIMGTTGSGKTSLISLIPRFTDATSGEISVDDVPVNMWDLKTLRSSIGIATQEVFLFSDTVDGNIAYGDTSLSEEDVANFARSASVDFIDNLPQGFDTIIGERGTGLSGGQKQRIALARAIAIKPSILILDDTTSAVDLETERFIQNQLLNLDFNCTKIIVAQRISTTKSADKIVIMDKGEIIQFGTHSELISQEGYYKEVFMLQNGLETNRKGGVYNG